jgi:hypothetical protein
MNIEKHLKLFFVAFLVSLTVSFAAHCAEDINFNFAKNYYIRCNEASKPISKEAELCTNPLDTPQTKESIIKLKEKCDNIYGKEMQKLADLYFCNGYLRGYVDTIYISQSFGKNIFGLCLPADGIPDNVLLSIMLQHISNSEINDDDTTRTVLFEALSLSYKCQQTNQ